MGIALDYTARIDPAALKAAGVTDVFRYVSLPQADTAWKRIGLAEYQELLAAGIRVTLNFEYAATDWLGGASKGSAHATAAVAAARALGYPAGCVIPGSADFNMTRAQWDSAGHAYAQAYAAGIRAGGYRPGVYGPYNVLQWCHDAGLMDMYWQAGMSTAWDNNAGVWPGAHVRQRRHLTVAGQDCDQNDILIPQWGQAGGNAMSDFDPFGKPPGNPREVGVYAADVHSQEFIEDSYYAKGNPSARTKRLIRTETKVDQLLAAAAAGEQRDNAALAAITALTALIQGAGGNLDAAPIIAAVHAVGDDTHAVVTQLQQELADARAELAAVRAELEATMSPAERSSLAPPAGA